MSTPLNAGSADCHRIVRRLYARGVWRLESAAHFGGEDTGAADMCLVRDAKGRPFIPGASLCGAGRSFLARLSQPWTEFAGEKEPCGLTRFFGGAKPEDNMSALYASDAPCTQGETLVRDGVRIDEKWGTAADQAKFDVEVLDRGATFDVRLACVIRESDNAAEVEQCFLALLHSFQGEEFRLGARKHRGYGRGSVAEWGIRDLRMDCPEDVLAWLQNDPWPRPASPLKPSPWPEDKRAFFRIEADLDLKTSLMVRSASAQPDAPDFVHITSDGTPTLPGTSLGGVLRKRAGLIARTLWSEEDAKRMIEEMFGPVHEPSAKGRALWASRVQVEEHAVCHVAAHDQHRGAIDRFTGGNLQSALFDERPVFPEGDGDGPHIRVRLTLEEPHEAEIALLLLTVRDLYRGDEAVGGEGSIGRGALNGKSVRFYWKECAKEVRALGMDELVRSIQVPEQAPEPEAFLGSRKPTQKGDKQ